MHSCGRDGPSVEGTCALQQYESLLVMVGCFLCNSLHQNAKDPSMYMHEPLDQRNAEPRSKLCHHFVDFCKIDMESFGSVHVCESRTHIIR